jgi:hypothetical protein
MSSSRVSASYLRWGFRGFQGAATVADDDSAIALEALEAIDRRGVPMAKSVIEFVASRANEARHGGAIS